LLSIGEEQIGPCDGVDPQMGWCSRASLFLPAWRDLPLVLAIATLTSTFGAATAGFGSDIGEADSVPGLRRLHY